MKVAASPRIYMGAMPESGGGAAIRWKRISNIRGANPVSLRSTAPSRGRGENVGRFECINPSFLWKEVPAGRRLGDAERSEKGASQAGDLRKHPSAADAVPLPQWGRQISSGYAAILADGIPVRKALTKLCIKILVEADSAMESAFP